MTPVNGSLREISLAQSLRGRPVCLPWIILPSLRSDRGNESHASSGGRGRLLTPPLLAMKSDGAVQAWGR
jgi:hypothetical protein